MVSYSRFHVSVVCAIVTSVLCLIIQPHPISGPLHLIKNFTRSVRQRNSAAANHRDDHVVSLQRSAKMAMSGSRDQVATVAAAVLVGGATWWWWSRVSSRLDDKSPPRVSGLPFIGSALEFGSDCRAFLRKYFDRFQTPIFTASIAGKDYHFVNTAHVDFSVERLFRPKQLSFQPVANDALQHGFGANKTSIALASGVDGEGKDIRIIHHQHLLGQGLGEMVYEIQTKLQPLLSMKSQVIGLYELVCKVLFHATLGTIISPSLAKDEYLESFRDFDSKIPLLIGKMPASFFPAAKRGRDTLHRACSSSEFTATRSDLFLVSTSGGTS